MEYVFYLCVWFLNSAYTYFLGRLTEPQSITVKGMNLWKVEHGNKFLTESIMEACLFNVMLIVKL